jgi:hypothetical protein
MGGMGIVVRSETTLPKRGKSVSIPSLVAAEYMAHANTIRRN